MERRRHGGGLQSYQMIDRPSTRSFRGWRSRRATPAFPDLLPALLWVGSQSVSLEFEAAALLLQLPLPLLLPAAGYSLGESSTGSTVIIV